MPLFFFHVRHGETLLEDETGSELANLHAAFDEALASAREIAADCLKANEVIDGRKIEITDGSGTVLGEVPVRAVVEK